MYYLKTKDDIYKILEIIPKDDSDEATLGKSYLCSVYKDKTIVISGKDVIKISDKILNLLDGIQIETETKIIIDCVSNLETYLDRQGMALPNRKIFGFINDEHIVCRIYGKTSTFLFRGNIK